MIRLVITGSKGRMGRTLIACVEPDPNMQVVAGVDVGDALEKVINQCDAVIDFSVHEITPEFLKVAAANHKPMVIGTTGHDADEMAAIRQAARNIPIVYSPNFSVGVNTLFYLTRKAAEILGPGFDMEVVEMHHRLKADAPSGTARRLVEILASERGKSYESLSRHGRVGDVGRRSNDEIGVHAVRGGDVIGDHTVIYAGTGERLELAHKASTRDTFAQGALRAVKWALAKGPGLYDMQDVLGLK